MDQQLHVVQRKLLNVVPQLILLIHALEKSQSGGPHLREASVYDQIGTGLIFGESREVNWAEHAVPSPSRGS